MVAVLFAMGLMSKPQVITLPFVLLLWDYWPLRRVSFGPPNPVRSPANRAFRDKPLLLSDLGESSSARPMYASAYLTMRAQAAERRTSYYGRFHAARKRRRFLCAGI